MKQVKKHSFLSPLAFLSCTYPLPPVTLTWHKNSRVGVTRSPFFLVWLEASPDWDFSCPVASLRLVTTCVEGIESSVTLVSVVLYLLRHLPSHESWLIFFSLLGGSSPLSHSYFVLHPQFPCSIKRETCCVHNLRADGFIQVFLHQTLKKMQFSSL